MTYTAYHRTHYPYAAELVARAPSLVALQARIEAGRLLWTDIYNDDATFHLQSTRGKAQQKLFIRAMNREKNERRRTNINHNTHARHANTTTNATPFNHRRRETHRGRD